MSINCTTNVPVSSFEWRNEAQAVLEIVMEQAVVLDFSLVTDDLQGQQFTCRAETAESTVYTETVEIQVVSKFQ